MTEHEESSSTPSASSVSLHELAAKACQGSLAARTELLTRLSRSMEKGIRAEFQGFRGKDEIEDLLQGCRLELLEVLEQGKSLENPRAYAYALGSNQAKKYLSKNSGQRHDRLKVPDLPPSLAWVKPKVSSPEEIVLPRQELESLRPRLMPRLTDKEKRVFQLHMIEEMSAPEIAKVLGISPNYVYQHVVQIRKKALLLRDTS